MPNHAKAIEAAARAMAASKGLDWDGKYKATEYANHGYWLPLATAAITAFLRTVEPSPAMIEAGVGQCDAAWQDDECELYLPDIHKAMSDTLANEVEQGDA